MASEEKKKSKAKSRERKKKHTGERATSSVARRSLRQKAAVAPTKHSRRMQRPSFAGAAAMQKKKKKQRARKKRSHLVVRLGDLSSVVHVEGVKRRLQTEDGR